MRHEAQCASATFIRHACWNWIETFPSEYYEMASGTRKLDGGAPERAFDAFMQIKTDQTRKDLWPTLSVLLVCSYERYKQVTLSLDDVKQYKRSNKEMYFIDKVRKSLEPGSKLQLTGMLAATDLARAGAVIPQEMESITRTIAYEIADNVKVSPLAAILVFIATLLTTHPFNRSSHPSFLRGE